MDIVERNQINRTEWKPIREDDAEFLLESVPPIYLGDGFACGEPNDFDDDGNTLYICVVRDHARICTLDEARKATC